MADKIGMMSEAYFKGKRELLEWAQDFLQLDIPDVAEFGKGSHYCQLLDAMYPRTVKMQRVNFSARSVPEYVNNWKLVQKVFEGQGIQKKIPVQRLIQTRFQDNLEFLQWFHQFFSSSYSGGNYDPIARRSKSKGGNAGRRGGGGVSRPAARASTTRHRPASRTTAASSKASSGGNNNNSALQGENSQLRDHLANLEHNNDVLKNQIKEKKKEMDNIQNVAAEIEKERDFYFAKVLKIETICKEHAGPEKVGDASLEGLVAEVLKVLYAPDEAEAEAGETPTSEAVEGGVAVEVGMES